MDSQGYEISGNRACAHCLLVCFDFVFLGMLASALLLYAMSFFLSRHASAHYCGGVSMLIILQPRPLRWGAQD